jgi:hypothetical protein
MSDSFCVFIISHGRSDNVITLKILKKHGYTGLVFIVCDNEDKTVEQYQKNFGYERVLVFDKLKYASMIDNCDNFQNRRTTTHARNACFDFAANRCFDYFLVLDDDYVDFRYTFDRFGAFVRKHIYNLDLIFKAIVQILNADDRVDSVCIMQTGDLIGGAESVCKWSKSPPFPFKRRKAMNSFFCKTSRRFWFFSRLNEDVNTYLSLGSRGRLFFTIPDAYLQQKQTQGTSGGMSEAYLSSGTYVKTFYTVMIGPSYCIATVTPGMNRMHHKISWKNAIPKIIDQAHKKL